MWPLAARSEAEGCRRSAGADGPERARAKRKGTRRAGGEERADPCVPRAGDLMIPRERRLGVCPVVCFPLAVGVAGGVFVHEASQTESGAVALGGSRAVERK